MVQGFQDSRMNTGVIVSVHGWLSKLWSLFGTPNNIRCRIIIGLIRIQKRDHNFDNHPHSGT